MMMLLWILNRLGSDASCSALAVLPGPPTTKMEKRETNKDGRRFLRVPPPVSCKD